MAIKRIIHDVPPERVQTVIVVIEQIDGGKAEQIAQDNGLVTVIGTYDMPAPPEQLPASGQLGDTWMAVAMREVGVKEKVGAADNPRIVAYHATTDGPAPDSVPWCSSFVNFCITEAGLVGTNRKNARSWTTWGRPIDKPVPGCIVVLWRESPTSELGHVGFYVGMEDSNVRLLGGNQGDAVNIASFKADRIIAQRIP